MSLQRLILTFKPEGVEVRVLYRRSLQAAPNPGTKARRREVTELTRTGLTQALEALDSEAGVECVGTSGFTTREDVLLATSSSGEARQVKGA